MRSIGRIKFATYVITFLLCLRTFASAPFANTQWPPTITPGTATVAGMASPNQTQSVAWFEWGTNSNFGNQSATTDAGSGSTVVYVTNKISGLLPAYIYHYRFVVSNTFGITYGAEKIFGVGRKVWGWGYNGSGEAVPHGSITNAVAVAASSQCSEALTDAGTLIGWGSGFFSTNPPGSTYSNLLSLCASEEHFAAKGSNGTVYSWHGYTPSSFIPQAVSIAPGQDYNLALLTNGTAVAAPANVIAVPSGLSNLVAVATGPYAALGLKNDGTIVAWGSNFYNQTNVPPDNSNVVSISIGTYNAFALKNDGTVVTWGTGDPVPTGLSNVVAIAANSSQRNMALRNDGTLVEWGNSGLAIPLGLSNVVAFSLGANHAVALGDNGAPSALPQTTSGFPGRDLLITLHGSDPNGDTLRFTILNAPSIGTLYQYTNGTRGDVITVSSVVSDPFGRVFYDPGSPNEGSPYSTFDFQVDDGQYQSAPATITVNLNWSTPAVTTLQPWVLSRTNLLLRGMVSPNFSPTTAWFEWGNSTAYGNTTTAFDAGGADQSILPTNLLTGVLPQAQYVIHYRLVASNAFGINQGADQLFAIGQRPITWGIYLPYYGSQTGTASYPFPLNYSNIVTVSGGVAHDLALCSDGHLVGWGDNSLGQTNAPTDATYVAIATGAYHNLALRSNGTVVAWGGLARAGEATVPTGLSNVVAISAGGYTSMALRSDSSIVVWGDNSVGAWNAPTNYSNIASITAPGYAVLNDGHVAKWGASSYDPDPFLDSQSNIAQVVSSALAITDHQYLTFVETNIYNPLPTNASTASAISGKGNFNIALQTNGSLLMWGDNAYGELNGPTSSNLVAISAGYYHGVAVPVQYPSITTPSAQPTNTSCSVSGRVSPGGTSSVAWFDWGTTPAFGNSTTTNSVLGTVNFRTIFATLTNLSPGSTYYLRIAVSNVFGTFYSATVSFIGTVPAPRLASGLITPDGTWQTSFTGISNANYTILCSVDLTNWFPVGTPVELSPGNFSFIDATATNYPSRFYRVSWP